MEAITLDRYEMAGITGFLIYGLSYGLMRFNKLPRSSVAFVALNIVAASLVVCSLIVSFNLAALLIQISWFAINLVALFQYKRPDQSKLCQPRWREEELGHWNQCA